MGYTSKMATRFFWFAMLINAILIYNAKASDVGTATQEHCKAKGMAYVRATVKGGRLVRRQHCRHLPGNSGKSSIPANAVIPADAVRYDKGTKVESSPVTRK